MPPCVASPAATAPAPTATSASAAMPARVRSAILISPRFAVSAPRAGIAARPSGSETIASASIRQSPTRTHPLERPFRQRSRGSG
ncbi:hypothetical protein GCM10007888_09780 [Methylobacterium oxalidis]|uniref:Uncharacterized protein n=1 Tax=Methylobacterium oxalidis TaxID=944322 RepID=A0ABQ6DDL6_9HYPH|nr:hypothetical protein GCM10007888_09780 [Methylobacterium oxalidis]